MKCLDTNWVILLFQDEQAAAKLNDDTLLISRISYIEFLSHSQIRTEDLAEITQKLRQNFQIAEIDIAVSDLAAEMRREIPALKLEDAIILATAITSGADLLTMDKRLQHYQQLLQNS